MFRIMLVIILAAVMIGESTAFAALKLIGSGNEMGVDVSSFPPAMKEAYPLFRKKCIKCHGLDRALITLQKGVAPSGSLFDNKSINGYGLKMLRKPDSNMTKQDVKIVMDLLRYMLSEAEKK